MHITAVLVNGELCIYCVTGVDSFKSHKNILKKQKIL